MKIKTLFVCFFKCSFLKRVCAVIFKLNEVSTSSFVKFQCQLITLNYLEKTNQIMSEKLAKMTMNSGTKIDCNQCKFSYMRKKYIFVRLYHYILIRTSVW